MTVFLTTHYMEETAGADYVAIIDKGIISAKGTPGELRGKYSKDSLRLLAKDNVSLEEFLKSQNIIFTLSGGAFIVPVLNSLEALPLINKTQNLIAGFEVISGSMDDAFVSITGNSMREDAV